MDITLFVSTISRVPKRSDLHILRKLWHMGVGLIGFFIYFQVGVEPGKLASFLFVLAAVATIFDLLRINHPKIQRASLLIMAPFIRRSELKSITGLPYYALGVALSLVLYQEKIALLSVLFLIFSDPISSFVGIKYGKDKILPNKSLQGSLAGFFVCSLLTVLYCMIYGREFTSDIIFFAISAGFVGSISELLSFLVDDNLTIPVISGLGLTLLNHYFLIF